MAKQPLIANRRAVLSSIALAGLAGAVPAIAQAVPTVPDRTGWDAAHAAYERADAAMNAFDRAHLTPAARRLQQADRLSSDPAVIAQRARLGAAYDRALARFEVLVDTRYEALNRLCTLNAPDIPSVSRKIELVLQDDRWECDDIEEILRAVRDDLSRLSGKVA